MEIYEKTEFGELLTRLIKERKMTQSFFFQKVGIGKAYFYDILAERISPSLEVQFKMLSILQPQKEDELKFFDLIAKAKNDLPADIFKYLIGNEEKYKIIREMMDKEQSL
jgi:predicted transcriptional regulator